MDFQSLRKEYENRGIDETELSACPIAQFEAWFQTATENRPGKWFETNAMALASADRQHNVSVRYVLLKGVDQSGFRFFTNYESQKGMQLKENPKCAAVIHWPHLGRQVRIEGRVETTSREESLQYFRSRPRGAQIGAAVSAQSEIIATREELDLRRQQLTEELDGAPVPLPDNWGGYVIQPARIEFWQGRLDRLHDRIVYQRTINSVWKRFRVSP